MLAAEMSSLFLLFLLLFVVKIYTYKFNVITQTESLKFVPDNDIHHGLCGHAIDIKSNFIIIGCPHNNNSDVNHAGSAVIYTFNGTSWDRGVTLETNTNSANLTVDDDDGFGLSVSISVMFAVVGSPYDNVNGITSGSVKVYSFDGMVWLPDGVKLTPDDGKDGDRFGYTVAMYMDTIAVGSPFADSGCVYIFINHGTWLIHKKIRPNDIFRVKHFGLSVTMHGEYIIIGTHSENLHDAGIIFIYKYYNNDYELEATLYALKAMDINGFRGTIDNDDNRIVIGSPIENKNGMVYVYKRKKNNLGWALETELEPDFKDGNSSDSNWFGSSVSINGNFMVVSSPKNRNNKKKFGCFYVFRLIRDKWVRAKRLLKSDEPKVKKFGSPVAMDDGRVLVGSVNNEGPGAAYLFNIYD